MVRACDVAGLVRHVLVGALQVVADGLLGGRGQGVQDLAHPGLTTRDSLALGHTGSGHQLRRHTLDLLDTAVVLAGLHHGLLGRRGGLVLLLRHTDRPDTTTVEELLDHRLLGGQQHLAGTEHDQLLAEQHADVVGHGAGDVDVVRHDQHGRVDLGVDIDQQLGQIRGTHRIQTGVRLVAQDDLRVQHQRAGQAGTLAHTAGDLTGELVPVIGHTDELELFHHDVADLGLGLLGVLTQREGRVVVDVHRAEQRTVLEQHTEQGADLVELLGRALQDVGAVDDDRAALRAQQADQRLQEHRLTGTRRAQQHADFTLGNRQRDVFPDLRCTERFAQSSHVDLDAHTASFRSQHRRATCCTRLWLESL